MTYYDRLTEDPDKALAAVAERRNLSLEQLRERIGQIHASARRGDHFTLGQAMSFLEAPDSATPELKGHVDSCTYCQALVDGLARGQTRGAERLTREIREALPEISLPRRAAHALARSVQPVALPAGLLAAGFVAAFFVIPNALVPHALAPRVANLSIHEFNRLRTENAQLRAAIFKAGLNSYEDVTPSRMAFEESDGEAVIAGTVVSSCTLVKTPAALSQVLCFTPSRSRHLDVTLNGADSEGRWTLAHAISSDESNPEGVAYLSSGHPFLSKDALRPGDSVLVYQPEAPAPHDSVKALEASLAALKDSVQESDKTPAAGSAAPSR